MTPAIEARRPYVAVIGSGSVASSDEAYRSARWVGRLLAASGAVVVTGGRGGVMEAASRGALSHGGLTIGILPGDGPEDSPPNPWVSIPIFTGIGDARNAVVVRTGQAVIAIGGGFGTLAEIGLAMKAGRPVVLLGSWTCAPPQTIAALEQLLHVAQNPREAVNLAVALAGAGMPDPVDIPEEPEADTSGEENGAPSNTAGVRPIVPAAIDQLPNNSRSVSSQTM